jgi:glycosyltransferase involved in cell wall biosynthesis
MNRVFRFYKYLPLYGWNPIILTINYGSFPIVDSTLLKEVRDDTKVFKSDNPIPSTKSDSSGVMYEMTDKSKLNWKIILGKIIKYNLIPDTRFYWYPFALKTAKEIFKAAQIDLVFSSSPPQTNHVIAQKIAIKYNLPWIADIRDPWSDVFWSRKSKYKLPFLSKLDKWLESKTLAQAQHITTVTPQLTEKYKNDYGDSSLIYNGYDGDYISSNDIDKKKSHSEFRITYSGSMSYNQRTEMFFRVLKKLKNHGQTKRLKVRFIGGFPSFLQNIIQSNDLEDICYIEDALPMDKLFSELQSSDLQLVFGVPGAEYGIIPSKIFDYMAVKKPILGINLDKDASQLIERTGLGFNFDDSSEDDLFNFLKRAISGNLPLDEANHEFIASFSRKAQTQQLAQIFDDVWSRRHH